MQKIGVTGATGFIAKHLIKTISISESFNIINFDRKFFNNQNLLDDFIRSCDTLVHLAAVNRHNDENFIYETNIELTKKLIESIKRTKSKINIIFASSTQEYQNNIYGNSKKKSRELFYEFSSKNNLSFIGLIIPNVFGPFGKPFYNSVVSTFCSQLINNNPTKIDVDKDLNLIYISNLVNHIIDCINVPKSCGEKVISYDFKLNVSKLLSRLRNFYEEYYVQGKIPKLLNTFDLNLFNTFRSHIDHASYFPRDYDKKTDTRGSFVELMRCDVGGQFSFSTTLPKITRGNHFHTRKVERFSVLKGKALIKMRNIHDNNVLEFYLDGDSPGYIDIPIWFTHNIKNIGNEVLYTNFWINEPYNEKDPDTYFINV